MLCENFQNFVNFRFVLLNWAILGKNFELLVKIRSNFVKFCDLLLIYRKLRVTRANFTKLIKIKTN